MNPAFHQEILDALCLLAQNPADDDTPESLGAKLTESFPKREGFTASIQAHKHHGHWSLGWDFTATHAVEDLVPEAVAAMDEINRLLEAPIAWIAPVIQPAG